MDEDDDPFRSFCTNVDNATASLKFNLNSLCEVNPEIAPGELDTAGLFGVDACVATNQSQDLTLELIVSDFTEQCDVPLMNGL